MFCKICSFLVIVAVYFTDLIFAQNSPDSKTDFGKLEMNTKLLEGARWAINELYQGHKINVYYAVEIQDIVKVDVDTMSIRIEFHMRERWEAKDLKWPPGLFNATIDKPDTFIRASQKILDSIWNPDTYIPNARSTSIATLTDPKSVVNLFQNKTIIFKARMSTLLGCNFNFQWYPLDEQICDLKFESYTLPSTFVSYQWETIQAPVSVSSIILLQYAMAPLEWGNGTVERWGRSDEYPFIYLRFRFARKLGHHMLQAYIPTTLVVILSWFSFWLGLDAIPARVSLLITCMLTIVTMHTSLKGSIPPVNYIKMMDIWMVGCIAFVFGAVAECIVVKYISWRAQQNAKAEEQRKKKIQEYLKSIGIDTNSKPKEKATNPYLEFYQNMNGKQKMDKDGPYPMIPLPGFIEGNDPDEENKSIQLQNRFNQHLMGIHTNANIPYGFPFSGINNFPSGRQIEDAPRPPWVVIDRISRVVFPVAFLIFNLSYWPYLYIGSSTQLQGQ